MNPTPQAEASRRDRQLDIEPAFAPFDLVVADASWSWTERLFSPLVDLGVRLLLLKACDWRTALNQGRPIGEWSSKLVRVRPGHWERSFVLPPGWMKSYPRLGMRPLARAVRDWRRGLDQPRALALAISYPHYLYLRDLIGPAALIYYNMDDYSLYWSSRRRSIQALERRAVSEADLSVFCARVRAEQYRSELSAAATRIVHVPHGAPSSAIPAAPQPRPANPPADIVALPRPLLGFVGTLEDRLDWDLVARIADDFSGGSVVLIGAPPARRRQAWYRAFRSAEARANVHLVGWRTPVEIARYTAAFDVCLIPYRADHPFNRVSCPTKVMDYMATSRPVVATDLPECRLYEHLFDVAVDADAFIAAIRRIVASGSNDGRARLRWHAAREATWERTAARLLGHFLDRTADRFGDCHPS
jgi:glycosyltransferase involved in cell wall biosynthesis